MVAAPAAAAADLLLHMKRTLNFPRTMLTAVRVRHRRQQRVQQSFIACRTAVCSRAAGTYQRLTSSASASIEERQMRFNMLGQSTEVGQLFIGQQLHADRFA